MPAKSEKQRKMMAIAEYHPEKLYKRNRGVLKMSRKQLSEYASTKGLHSPAKIQRRELSLNDHYK